VSTPSHHGIDAALLREWCELWLGAEPERVLFRKGHLSAVVGLRLRNGEQVVVKARPPDGRIAGCVAVQRHLFAQGFPCPRPIAGPEPLGNAVATAEALVPEGSSCARAGDAHQQLATLLADLVRRAPSPAEVPPLEPAPPWVGWAHEGPGPWPVPDDLDLDLNEHVGPAWIDDTAVRLRERLSLDAADPIVGHVDWESHNIRWLDDAPHIVDDWDSVAALPEQAMVGAAAAVYPASADGSVVAATIAQTEAFLRAYPRARGRWGPGDEQVCWAAGLWVMTYNAKKEVVGRRTGRTTLGGSTGYAEHCRRELQERLRRAGA
jgi:hypothetical protein